jgi:hypothetical protein
MRFVSAELILGEWVACRAEGPRAGATAHHLNIRKIRSGPRSGMGHAAPGTTGLEGSSTIPAPGIAYRAHVSKWSRSAPM